jgi:hypothetical protein
MDSGCPNVVLIFGEWAAEFRNLVSGNYVTCSRFNSAMPKLESARVLTMS